MHLYDIKLIFGTGWWLGSLLLHRHGLARYCSTSGIGPLPPRGIITNNNKKPIKMLKKSMRFVFFSAAPNECHM